MASAFDDYLEALAAGDPAAAVVALERAHEEGVSRKDVVRDIVARAQHRVGEQWHRGACSVVEEHAATAVAEQALALFAPPEFVRNPEHFVLLACSEGEWHSFPPRLAAARAASPGLRLIVLGGSLPAETVGRFLSQSHSRPGALALSTTMPVRLIGAARSIRAARAEGVPVVVGGAAWGGSQHRAHNLGAHLYLDDPTQLSAAVAQLSGPPPLVDLPDVPDEVSLLERPPEHLLRAAYERQLRGSRWMRAMTPAQEERTIQDFGWMARHAAASVLCDDPTIVRDLLDWLLRLLSARGVPSRVIFDGALYLADAVEACAPRAAEILHMQALVAQDGLVGAGGDPDADSPSR